MDIMTGVGLVSGILVVTVMALMGGDLHMFVSEHAVIIIFGGSIAATMIRFPLSAILHGLPLGAKFAFTMSRLSARDLVDELARIAEIARKQGPVGLEKVETDEPFLAKGIRYVADGYDLEFIRDNLERDRDNFLMHLDEGGKIYRAIGDCAPAFGMHPDRHGADVRQHDRSIEARSIPWQPRRRRRSTARWSQTCSACRSPTSCTASCSMKRPTDVLIIDGILMIRDFKSPTLVREMLLAYLPEKHRHEEGELVSAEAGRSGFGKSTMAKKKRGDAHGGGHRPVRDLCRPHGLMMSFFVMLVAFSTMDNNKLKIVAGSMRDAFGVQTEVRYSGIVEFDGLPTRLELKNTAHIPPEEFSTRRPRMNRSGTGPRAPASRSIVNSRSPEPSCDRHCRTCRS